MNKEESLKTESKKNHSRLKEITAVLRKYAITRGVTPEKLRMILEDLGPTYIKLGQIMSMHSDILPERYCEELMRLRSEVPPMPFEQVEEVIQDSFGCPWNEIFLEIEKNPLGSASIAQVDRKSTRLNSSHVSISYAVFCLKKKITITARTAALHD